MYGDFKEGASSMDPIVAVEKLSVSLHSYEPFCITDTNSFKSLVAPDVSRTDVLVGAFNSIRIAELPGQRENEVQYSARFDDASETNCPDIICSSPRKRSTCMSNSYQKRQTKQGARKCRKTANKKPLLDLTFLKVGRRRRSCFCKQARSSAWGLLGNIDQIFEWNAGEHRKSRKARSGFGGGKRTKSKTGQSSQRSKGESCASTSRIRLKIKLGKEVGQNCLLGMVPVNDLEKYGGTRTEFPKLTKDIEGKLEEEVLGSMGFQHCNGKLEKAIMVSDNSVLDVQVADKGNIERSALNSAYNHDGIPSQEDVVGLGVTVDNSCLDPGTSPDSEVINLIPEAQIRGKVPEYLHDVLISSPDCVGHEDGTSLSLTQASSKKGEKKNKLSQVSNCNVDCRLPSPEIIDSVSLFEKCSRGEKMGDGSYSSEASVSTTIRNASGNTCSNEVFSMGQLSSPSRAADFGVSAETLKIESVADVDLCSGFCVGCETPESRTGKLPPCTILKGRKLPKSSRTRGLSKCRVEVPDSVSRKGNACRPKGNQDKSPNESKVKEKDDVGQTVFKVESYPETGDDTLDGRGDSKIECRSTTGEISNLNMVPNGLGDQCIPPRNAWVCCDVCYKWRRIAAVLADSIEETNCRWICKDNINKDFADCSIPQEKSNAEINAELEISEVSCEEDACDARLNSNRLGQKQPAVPQQSSWKLIKSNLFLHRSRKTQTIDEIMVCHCKGPLGGRMGCGDGCLNRMLNIECVKGTCPCGELCSNQQFQKRKYAKLKCFRCGKKGYGLQLLEDIPKGQFLIEYVGEVLDMHPYEARQREYASKGHKHFYFMTLNGSEVIDACAKGNLGRFINHSCEPNCRTEKWMVNGEVCIGLFAIRNIKKGEEVTFDYNYVRVFGAAAKKCVCGSSQCRGYIGGDRLNTEVIVQGDSDDEYPEPVMVCEDGDNIISATSYFDGTEMQTAENLLKNKDEMNTPETGVGHLKITKEMITPEILLEDKGKINYTTAVRPVENTVENKDSMKRSSADSNLEVSSEVEGSVGLLPFLAQPIETSLQHDDGKSEITSAAQQEFSVAEETTNTSLFIIQGFEKTSLNTKLSRSLPDTNDTKRKPKPITEEDRCVVPKTNLRVKTSRSSSSVKKGKSKNNALNISKPPEMDIKSHIVVPYRSKKLSEGSSNGRFEAVQEKLNELLDADGGISKRKDASRGYLKLLFLTAASGDSGNGEAIQSNRDLSMILGALLKTKSRTVLVDVMNKNGLQMLHNIMKRYRREFNKIPILRKLLKVLEYLAVREILTLEHINRGPPCLGVESFRESILTLTDHIDKQVHQIARNFRDKWIPRPIRKNNCMDRDVGQMEFQRGSNCSRFLVSNNPSCDQDGRPTEVIEGIKQSVIATTPVRASIAEGCSTSCSSSCITNGTKTRKRKSRWDQPGDTSPGPRSPRHKEPRIQRSSLQKSYSSQESEIGEVLLDHITGTNGEDRNLPLYVHNFSQEIKTNIEDDGRQNTDEDVPPGFSPPLKGPLVPPIASSTAIDLHQEMRGHAKCPCEVGMGHPQEKFNSRLSVSYGISLSVVQQFGTPQPETVENWLVAPGMPFHPFPPLPPYPRENRDHPAAANSVTINLPETDEQERRLPVTYRTDQNIPSTSGACPPDVDILGANNQHNFQRVRDSSNSLGRNYFRQQKWNNSKFEPHRIRNRNAWGGFMGNNSRNGMCSIGVGSGEIQPKGPHSSEEVSYGVETSGYSFYQHPH